MASVASPSTDTRTSSYLLAERALWEHYGLSPSETFLELDSPPCRLRVLEVGSGDPVLFVHGTVGPGAWASLLGELGGFRAIVLDRPGWGLSSPVDFDGRDYGHAVADLLRDTLDALGLDRAHVVGGSIGDVWALRLAARHPSRVRRVALLGAGPIVPEAGVPGIIRLIASPAGGLLVRVMTSPARVRTMLRRSGHGASLDKGLIPDVFVEWRAAAARDTDAMRHERAMVRRVVSGNAYTPDLTFDERELAAIVAPTLMVYGSEDGVGSVDVWERVTSTLPHGQLQVVAGAGHMPWLDDPAGGASRVRRFLSDVPR
jgi:pimeloyl-ACP methyl ester carboxylesterase